MYRESGLIHEPASEFTLIAVPGEQFLMTKRFSSAAHDLRCAFRLGDAMPTHDGHNARMTELDVKLAHYPKVQAIKTYHEFRAALLENCPMNVRTRFALSDGTEVVLEYPARTVNIAHDREAWQIDAGPVLLPLCDTATGVEPGLEVEKLGTGYLVFNRADYAEAILRRAVILPEGGSTSFYDSRRNFDCCNEVFAASE